MHPVALVAEPGGGLFELLPALLGGDHYVVVIEGRQGHGQGTPRPLSWWSVKISISCTETLDQPCKGNTSASGVLCLPSCERPALRPTTAEAGEKGDGKGVRPEEVRPEPDPETQPGENLSVRAGYLELINSWWNLRNQNYQAAQLAWNFLVDTAPPHLFPRQTGEGTNSTTRRV